MIYMKSNTLDGKYLVIDVKTGKPIETCFVMRPAIDDKAAEALEVYREQLSQDNDLYWEINNWLHMLDC